MRLLVVSHTPHHRDGDRLVGWGPTVREIDQLATLFDEIVHVAPVHGGAAPPSELPYRARERPRGGGAGGRRRLTAQQARRSAGPARVRGRDLAAARALRRRSRSLSLEYRAGRLRSFSSSDAGPPLRWIKYAGNWRPKSRESWSYRLQRWILDRRLTRSLVTVNGRWPNQPVHVRSFLNPGLTEGEFREGAAVAATKRMADPLRLLFVGRVDAEKGCGRAIEILAALKARGLRVGARRDR